MFRFLCVTVCFLASITFGDAASASFIKPCKPDDHACILASSIAAAPHFVAGDKELGIESMDPIVLNDVRADNKDLKLGFRNMHVAGLRKCKILDCHRDPEKSTIMLSLECPLQATGQYDLEGKILFIPAEGNGDFKIVTDKVKIDVTVKIKVVETGGEKYWKLTGFDYSYDIIEKATIDMKNLFGGDETRAKPIRDIFDNGWKELITEVGGPIVEELITKVIKIAQKFFKNIPVSELELS